MHSLKGKHGDTLESDVRLAQTNCSVPNRCPVSLNGARQCVKIFSYARVQDLICFGVTLTISLSVQPYFSVKLRKTPGKTVRFAASQLSVHHGLFFLPVRDRCKKAHFVWWSREEEQKPSCQWFWQITLDLGFQWSLNHWEWSCPPWIT